MSWEKATRHISLALPATEWALLLEEIDQRGPEDRFRCSFEDDTTSPWATARLGELIARGYSWERGGPALVPRPSGVLHIISSPGADEGVPAWMVHGLPRSFRHHIVAVDVSAEVYDRLASASAVESWHLDASMPRGGWAEFIVEFICSREIDVVQIVLACVGADLVPALREAYPDLRVVVDAGGAGALEEAWATYVVSRYGNVIDAFFTSESAVAAKLATLGVSSSRIHMGHPDDEELAGRHMEMYGQLLAGVAG